MRIWINHYEGPGSKVKTTGINISAKLTVRDLKCIVADKLRKVVNSFYLVYNKNGFKVLLAETFSLKFFDMKRVSVITVVDIPQNERKTIQRTKSIAKPKPVAELETQSSLIVPATLVSQASNEPCDSQESDEGEDSEASDQPDEFEKPLFSRQRSNHYDPGSIVPNQFMHNLVEQSMEASKTGDLSKLETVIMTLRRVGKEPGKILNTTDANCWTCLHYACLGGHENIVKTLLDNKVSVNVETNNNWIPLQLAASIGNLGCIQLLLDDPNIQINKMTKSRGPALHIATEFGYIDCVAALLARNAAKNIEDFRGRRPSTLASNDSITTMLANLSDIKRSVNIVNRLEGRKGTVYYTTSLYLHDYEVFLDINIEKGTLDRYKSECDWVEAKTPAYKTPLISIQEVNFKQILKGDGTYYYMFVVKVKSSKYKFYTLDKDLTEAWIESIKLAIDYCHASSKQFQVKLDALLPEEYKIESIVEIDPALKPQILETQEAKETQEVKETEKSQEFKEVKQTEKSQEVNEANETEKSQEAQEIAETQVKLEIYETEEISKLQETQEEAKLETIAIDEEMPVEHLPAPQLQENIEVEEIIHPEPTPSHPEPVPQESSSSNPSPSKPTPGPSQNLEPAESHPLENAAEPTQSEVELSLNSFDTLEILGTGSFGRVHRVKHKKTGEVFAIKALNKRFLQKQRLLKYSISECKIMRDLSHPYIIRLHYAFQDNQELYMVLDYCPNRDLEFLLKNLEKLPEDDVRFYTAEVLCALQYLHERDVVYRDLKPANILVAEDGHIKLADFGLAKEGVKDVRAATTFAGTPVYMAPEIMHGYGYGKAADIYSLGVLIYELLAGVPPYNHKDPLQLYKLIEKASLNIPKHFSKAAKDLVQKLLRKIPSKRLSFQDIKKHAFFKGVDWVAYSFKQHKAPASSFLAKDFKAVSDYKDDPDYANF